MGNGHEEAHMRKSWARWRVRWGVRLGESIRASVSMPLRQTSTRSHPISRSWDKSGNKHRAGWGKARSKVVGGLPTAAEKWRDSECGGKNRVFTDRITTGCVGRCCGVGRTTARSTAYMVAHLQGL
jgi:hypothetical protein